MHGLRAQVRVANLPTFSPLCEAPVIGESTGDDRMLKLGINVRNRSPAPFHSAIFGSAMTCPTKHSNGLLDDLRQYLIHRPRISTLVQFEDEEARNVYSARMQQRVGTDFSSYAILNIHRIGIDVPCQYVFEELLKWNGDSTCWPNHLAEVNRLDDHLSRIDIFLLGRKRYPFGMKSGPFGWKFIPLFSLSACRIKAFPNPADPDNERFLHYESSGGYPIGHFILYARSSIATEGEKGSTQLFMAVGFNFYGKARRAGFWLPKRLWDSVHNRVTSNILNRFRLLCEWKFQRRQDGR